jgi:hypothetical protein
MLTRPIDIAIAAKTISIGMNQKLALRDCHKLMFFVFIALPLVHYS